MNTLPAVRPMNFAPAGLALVPARVPGPGMRGSAAFEPVPRDVPASGHQQAINPAVVGCVTVTSGASIAQLGPVSAPDR